MTKDYDLIFCFAQIQTRNSALIKFGFPYTQAGIWIFTWIYALLKSWLLSYLFPPNGTWVNQNSTLLRIFDSDLFPPIWILHVVTWNILRYSNFGFHFTFPKPEFSVLPSQKQIREYWFPNAWSPMHRHGDISSLCQKYIAIAFLCIMEWSSICSVSHVIHTHNISISDVRQWINIAGTATHRTVAYNVTLTSLSRHVHDLVSNPNVHCIYFPDCIRRWFIVTELPLLYRINMSMLWLFVLFVHKIPNSIVVINWFLNVVDSGVVGDDHFENKKAAKLPYIFVINHRHIHARMPTVFLSKMSKKPGKT